MDILITGANRGLGLGFVEVGLEKGYRVFAGVRDPNEQKRTQSTKLKEKNSNQLEILHLDVTDEESVREAARNVGESLDVIINNAAILNGRGTSIEDLDIEAIKLAFDVNTLGPARVIKHFLPLLKKGENQSIINISSEGGSLTNAYSGDYPYGLSKAALNMLSEKLHVALKNEGIQVLSVHPGWVRTDMGGMIAPTHPKETAEDIYNLINRQVRIDSEFVFVDYQGKPMSI
nr:SDR family oxidoreductase [Bacillus velezensis]